MAAAAVTVNSRVNDLTNPNYKIERVNVTLAATGDWYDCTEIHTVLGATVSPNYAMAAADSIGITWATNRVTFAAVAGATTGTFQLVVWGTA